MIRMMSLQKHTWFQTSHILYNHLSCMLLVHICGNMAGYSSSLSGKTDTCGVCERDWVVVSISLTASRIWVCRRFQGETLKILVQTSIHGILVKIFQGKELSCFLNEPSANHQSVEWRSSVMLTTIWEFWIICRTQFLGKNIESYENSS